MSPAPRVVVGRPTREYLGMLSPAEVERVQGDIAEACGQDRLAPFARAMARSLCRELRIPAGILLDYVGRPCGQRVAR